MSTNLLASPGQGPKKCQLPDRLIICPETISEVSKRGWRTEGLARGNPSYARLACSCAPYRIQNPSESQNTPQIHPESSPETKIHRKNTKKLREPPIFVYFSYFFCILVSRGGSDSVGGARTRNARHSGLFSVPFFLCLLRRRGTYFWRTFLGVCLSPTACRQPLNFRNL